MIALVMLKMFLLGVYLSHLFPPAKTRAGRRRRRLLTLAAIAVLTFTTIAIRCDQ